MAEQSTDSASEQELAKRANDGLTEVSEGIDTLGVARDAVRISATSLAAGARDLTRAADAEIVAGRLSTLSEIVQAAGSNDLGQGAEMLMASEDVEAMSAVVGLMSLSDLERGLELGRLAGELQTIGNVVAEIEMPVLAAVLGDRGRTLQQIAVDVILRAAATRSLAQLMDATGQQLADLGAEEIDEGAMRVAAANIAAQRSAELAAGGLLLGLRGTAEIEDAKTLAGAARDLTVEGVTQVASGSAQLGRAAGQADTAAKA